MGLCGSTGGVGEEAKRVRGSRVTHPLPLGPIRGESQSPPILNEEGGGAKAGDVTPFEMAYARAKRGNRLPLALNEGTRNPAWFGG